MPRTRFTYFCFGFKIASDIAIPELQDAEISDSDAYDLRIRLYPHSAREQFTGLQTGYNVRDRHAVLLHLPELATFVIRDGREIGIFQSAGADPEDIRLYLLGSALGAAMHQRATLPLHASAVRTEQGVMAFSAVSGSGKSTLAAALWHRGFDLVSDDVLVLKHNTDGRVTTFRGTPCIKILPDALTKFTAEDIGRFAWNKRTGKYYIPAWRSPTFDELQVERIYFLHDAAKEQDGTQIHRLAKTDSMIQFVSNIYRSELIGMRNTQKLLLPPIAGIVAAIDCFAIKRPRVMRRLDQFVDIVERHITA